MKDFLPSVGARQHSTVAAKRERFYQGVIWLLVIWNLCLQARSLSKTAEVAVPASSVAYAQTLEQEFDTASSATGSFVAPSEEIRAYGAAGVVCSGCTSTSNSSSDDSSPGPSTGSIAAATAGVAAGVNASALAPAPAPATESAAAAAVPSAASVSTTGTQPSPLEAASLKVGAAAAEKAAAANGGAAVGKNRAVDGTPPPQISPGLPEGGVCNSSFKGDANVAQCLSFCIGKYARTHCQRCKCKSCSFCPRGDASRDEQLASTSVDAAPTTTTPASTAPPAAEAAAARPSEGAAPPIANASVPLQASSLAAEATAV